MMEPVRIFYTRQGNKGTVVWFFQDLNIVCTESFDWNKRGVNTSVHLVGGTEKDRTEVADHIRSFHHELHQNA